MSDLQMFQIVSLTNILFDFAHKYFCLKYLTSFAKVCELEGQKIEIPFHFPHLSLYVLRTAYKAYLSL